MNWIVPYKKFWKSEIVISLFLWWIRNKSDHQSERNICPTCKMCNHQAQVIRQMDIVVDQWGAGSGLGSCSNTNRKCWKQTATYVVPVDKQAGRSFNLSRWNTLFIPRKLNDAICVCIHHSIVLLFPICTSSHSSWIVCEHLWMIHGQREILYLMRTQNVRCNLL